MVAYSTLLSLIKTNEQVRQRSGFDRATAIESTGISLHNAITILTGQGLFDANNETRLSRVSSGGERFAVCRHVRRAAQVGLGVQSLCTESFMMTSTQNTQGTSMDTL